MIRIAWFGERIPKDIVVPIHKELFLSRIGVGDRLHGLVVEGIHTRRDIWIEVLANEVQDSFVKDVWLRVSTRFSSTTFTTTTSTTFATTFALKKAAEKVS